MFSFKTIHCENFEVKNKLYILFSLCFLLVDVGGFYDHDLKELRVGK